MNHKKLWKKLNEMFDILPSDDDLDEITQLVFGNYKECAWCGKVFEYKNYEGEHYCSILCEEQSTKEAVDESATLKRCC